MAGAGVLICIEGLDGSGKTTQTRLLVKKLKKHYNASYTAEPSRGNIGKLIKKRCLHAEKRGSVVVEALLFAADRVDHVQNEVLPALRKGRVLISDRYIYSSYAYQGAGGLDIDWIEKLNKHAILPDLAIFIDVKPETVVQRLKSERSVMEDLETQRRVRKIYLNYVEKGHLVRIDGNKPKRAVAKDLFRTVQEFLEKSR